MLEREMPIEQMQEFLSHSKLETTQVLPWLSGGRGVLGEVPRQDPVCIDDVPMTCLAQQPS